MWQDGMVVGETQGSEYFTLAHKRQYMSLEPHIHKNEDPRPSKTHTERAERRWSKGGRALLRPGTIEKCPVRSAMLSPLFLVVLPPFLSPCASKLRFHTAAPQLGFATMPTGEPPVPRRFPPTSGIGPPRNRSRRPRLRGFALESAVFFFSFPVLY
jgi:hypothetical protein